MEKYRLEFFQIFEATLLMSLAICIICYMIMRKIVLDKHKEGNRKIKFFYLKLNKRLCKVKKESSIGGVYCKTECINCMSYGREWIICSKLTEAL